MSRNKKLDWTATKPVSHGGFITYEIHRLDTVIKCSTRDDMKTVKQKIRRSLDRLNNKTKGGYT